MDNFAICVKEQTENGIIRFHEGKKYEAKQYTRGKVILIEETGNPITVCMDDLDFCFVLNCPDYIKMNLSKQ